MRAPAAGVPVLLLEIDRRTEDAHDLVAKLRRYWEWGRLLPKDADRHTVELARSRPDGIEHVDHEKRLWRRVHPPAGREGLAPVAFVFADTTEAKVVNTVAVLEEAGRRFWAPRRYESYYREVITAKDYSQAVPIVLTTLEQLQEHGAGAAVWRRLAMGMSRRKVEEWEQAWERVVGETGPLRLPQDWPPNPRSHLSGSADPDCPSVPQALHHISTHTVPASPHIRCRPVTR